MQHFPPPPIAHDDYPRPWRQNDLLFHARGEAIFSRPLQANNYNNNNRYRALRAAGTNIPPTAPNIITAAWRRRRPNRIGARSVVRFRSRIPPKAFDRSVQTLTAVQRQRIYKQLNNNIFDRNDVTSLIFGRSARARKPTPSRTHVRRRRSVSCFFFSV